MRDHLCLFVVATCGLVACGKESQGDVPRARVAPPQAAPAPAPTAARTPAAPEAPVPDTSSTFDCDRVLSVADVQAACGVDTELKPNPFENGKEIMTCVRA